MSRFHLGTRLHRAFGAMTSGGRRKGLRRPMRGFPGVEPLEGRALMANITPSGVISSTAAGADFNYTINLANSSSSNSGIGTFWFAWTPGQDYLATSPIAVTPPTGWTDQTIHAGAGDGYSIEFTASSPANDVQPGASLAFSFESADNPASVGGNSVFYPGVPVGTAFVYPQGAFSDSGHQFVVTPASTPTPTPTSTAPVTITDVRLVENRRHMVTQIVIAFSGGLNATDANNEADFVLTTAGKGGSFVARNARHIALGSALYNPALDMETLLPGRAFALTKSVQLVIHGQPPGGLRDSSGNFIDAGNEGHAGDDGVFVLTRRGVSGA